MANYINGKNYINLNNTPIKMANHTNKYRADYMAFKFKLKPTYLMTSNTPIKIANHTINKQLQGSI